jgi:ribosomal protein S18 acetylase RimI-like enzyme
MKPVALVSSDTIRMQIRTANEGDHTDIEKVVVESFEPITWARTVEEKHGLLNGLDWRMRWKLRLHKIFAEQFLLVGIVDAHVVSISSSTIDREAALWYIDLLAVARNHRGRGYGREMLRATIRHAQKAGAQYVHLTCMVTNENANELYRSEGFEEVAREIRWFRRI